MRDLDAFWQRAFVVAGTAYRAPSVEALAAPVVTSCGPADPEHLALYCPVEEAIYYSPAGFDEHRRCIGDFAPIVVLAHEWGHHIQRLLGVTPSPGNAVELQADCLAGVYARDAGQRGLLDPGDVTEAVAIAAALGDPLGLPQDAPGAHGINDDRISAFMRGYLGGLAVCELAPRSPSGIAGQECQHKPADNGKEEMSGGADASLERSALTLGPVVPPASSDPNQHARRTATAATVG